MQVAIMQPYFFPYIGYFQLINAADQFVVYDNIKYVKNSWINRNRILVNGSAAWFTLPLKKAPDHLHIDQRQLAETFVTERNNMLNQIKGCYSKAPFFKAVYPLVEEILHNTATNLFEFLLFSLKQTCSYLGIQTAFITSSVFNTEHALKGQNRVIDICKQLSADQYINLPGGKELYAEDQFAESHIQLHFLSLNQVSYQQFDGDFIPHLSIIDVLMFNPAETIQKKFLLPENLHPTETDQPNAARLTNTQNHYE